MSQLSSRTIHAGLITTALTLGACSDASSPTAVPVHARRDAAPGTVIVVTNTNGGALAGSLRDAIKLSTGGETILFDPSLAGATITLDTTLDIPNNVTIRGLTDKGVTISGGGKFMVLSIHKGATLENLTITGGKSHGNDVAGGILSTGPLVVKQSTIAANAGFDGGGIRGDDITLVNSTVTNNSADGDLDVAAGIDYQIGGSLTLISSSVSNNTGGSGLSAHSGPATGHATKVLLRNSIIAGNEVRSCSLGTEGFTYEGVNIASDKTCGTPILNMIVADPLLEALADNGGPTQTRALNRNSPAINATDCFDVSIDQRFVPRDFKCDIGPFEFVFTTVTLTVDPMVGVDARTGAATVTGTVQCTRDETFDVAVEVQQNEKIRKTPITVDATQSTTVGCGTTARPWIVLVQPPSDAAFENGDATVTAQTVKIANGVIPSSASITARLARQKK